MYLAYGSNLNLDQMDVRCPGAELIGYTTVSNMRLIFRGSGSGYYLSIERTPAGMIRSVPCGVFRISDADEKSLDVYEGYPRFYKKKLIKDLPLYMMDGSLRSGKLTAMAYVLPRSAPLGFPSNRYIQTCVQGYNDFGFDSEILRTAIEDTLNDMF